MHLVCPVLSKEQVSMHLFISFCPDHLLSRFRQPEPTDDGAMLPRFEYSTFI